MPPRRRRRLAATAVLAALTPVLGLATACARPSAVDTGDKRGTPTTTHPTPPAAHLPTPLPVSALRDALGCPAWMGVTVSRRAPAPHANPPSVVVAAHCASGAGSPPSGVFVLTALDEALVISATLVAARQQIQVDAVSVTGDEVRVEGSTYSRPSVPRCCPDVPYARSWMLVGGRARPSSS